MILESRTNQGILRLPKDGCCASSSEKPNVWHDKGEKGPVVNSYGDNNSEGKPQHEQSDESNHVPSHTVVTKPRAVNASTSSSEEKASPLADHGLGKPTYNPITHAPSMRIFMYTVHIFNTGQKYVVFISISTEKVFL